MFSKHRSETITYLVLWGLLFIAPVLSLYIRTATDSTLTFDWSEVYMVWRQYGVFFAIFLIHNHLLAPLLVHQQRRTLYFSIVSVLIGGFVLYQCTHQPMGMKRHKPQMEQRADHRPPHLRFDDEHRPDFEKFDGEHRPDFDKFDGEHRPPEFDDERPPRKPDGMMKRDRQRPSHMLDQHDIVSTILLVLMLFANLGIKLYFKQRHDERQMAELERKNLEQQLEYLKYQLNPHFLMNTLNNIHALVDIDPERAQEAIINLSKILRYVLYESNHERVPMSKEREFMENYATLMRMRYGDKLSFSTSLLDDVTGISVPPLIFISFVENAFKHGVSYQKPSFIAISSKRYKDKNSHERLLWACRNSKHPKPDKTTTPPRQGGVGLTNVRQRLDLIYEGNYSINISETDDTYEVTLDIPLEA